MSSSDYKSDALGVLMGTLEFSISRLWLSYCAFVVDCLMQLFSYLLWIKRMFNITIIGR